MTCLGEHALAEGAGEDDFVTVLPCVVHRSDWFYIPYQTGFIQNKEDGIL